MPVAVGTRLGPYEILSPLGAGGMGEVYRARDTTLGRDVALKVLSPALAGDSQYMARFQREAQLLASLNHPNIAILHGMQEESGVRALVMELVEGPTLAERIALGPISMEEALPIARQIAEALETAHERGIIHRDLKPGNVKLTNDGVVKVLDFGLAKALDDETTTSIANSPTITMAATRAGVILGTAAYMSPEQAKGRRVDRRADIWSFGVVLYEMLTGRQMYSGETAAETLAFVMTKEPGFDALPTATPPAIRNLLRRCLVRDPRLRLQAIGEARIVLEAPTDLAGREDNRAVAKSRRHSLPAWAVIPVAAVAAVGSGVAVWLTRAPAPVPRPVVHLSAPVPQLASNVGIALSRDGSRVAYAAGSPPRLHVRMLDQLEGKSIPGTENALDPFFSPDGQWLGFYQEGKWKKVQVIGGATITLCDGSASPYGSGASWGPDGTIVFGALNQGLSRVSAAGGAPQAITQLDQKRGDRAHRWPQILQDGKAVLYAAAAGTFDDAKIIVLSLNSGKQRVLIDGGAAPLYVATGPPQPGRPGTGHIIYWRGASLFAVPFDLGRLELAGSSVPILEGVQGIAPAGAAHYSVSEAGSLVYVPGGLQENTRNLVWVDRQGKAQPIPAPPNPYVDVRLSPEGQRVAVNIGGGVFGIWVWDLLRGTLTKLTFQGVSVSPVWTPDGKWVTFATGTPGKQTIARTLADGSGQPEALSKVEGRPSSWSPDGKLLAFQSGPPSQTDIFLLPTTVGGVSPAARPFLQTQHNEMGAIFSPDGRWIAYTSLESGQPQVYVRPAAPGGGGQWLISTGGGVAPRWASGGRELFYRAGGKVMVVPIEPGPTFRPGTPKELFSYGAYPAYNAGAYDVSADGKRLLMITSGTVEQGSVATPEIHFVLEWFEDIRRRIRAGG